VKKQQVSWFWENIFF